VYKVSTSSLCDITKKQLSIKFKNKSVEKLEILFFIGLYLREIYAGFSKKTELQD